MDAVQIVGYSREDLNYALTVMEDSIAYGEKAQIELCTAEMPSPGDLEGIYQDMLSIGCHLSYPTAQNINGVPTTSFALRKGSPAWALIIPLIVPILTLGLVTFGITKIETITKALVPLLLITVGGMVVLAAVASKPVTTYIERGGKVPYLPAVVKKKSIPLDLAARELGISKDELKARLSKHGVGYGLIRLWDRPHDDRYARDKALDIQKASTGVQNVRIKSGVHAGSIISISSWEDERERMIQRGESPPVVEYLPKAYSEKKLVASTVLQEEEQPVPATEPQPEPVPEKYRDLIPLIDEPLPAAASFLPAVLPEERERKIDSVMKQLKDGVENIQDSELFRHFLTTMSKFHDYSIGNIILIAFQKPGATHVAGFNRWKDLGRYVKKGEKGISILAPVMPPKEKVAEGEEEEPSEVPESPVFFKVVYVFDISQTEGKPLPEFDVPVLTGEANEDLFLRVMALVKAQNVEVSFEPRPEQNPAVKGLYVGKSIWIKPDEARAQQLKSLLHEMAHYYTEGVFRIPRADAETIAESVAYVIGSHYGFDTGSRSFPYVALWAQEKKVLQNNLAYIRKVSASILEGLEPHQTMEGKLVPALKPFEPYHFAEYVLRYNRFSDAEIPIYSGISGRNPLRVPDRVWREVIEDTDGEFVKQGDINIFHIPEKERPPYMRAAPTWRDVASNVPATDKDFEIVKMFCLECGNEVEKPSAFRTQENMRKYMVSGLCQACQDRAAAEEYFKKHPGEGELAPSTSKKEFIKVGDRVRVIPRPGYKYRYGNWPKDVWIGEEAVEGTVTEFHPYSPEFRVGSAVFEALEAWAKVQWDNGATTAISPEDEGSRWERVERKQPAVIPIDKSSPKDEKQFIADSPEFLAYTIEDIGYRQKFDQVFTEAIARANKGE